MMKFMFAPPAPGGVGANQQVLFNDNGALAGDSGLTYNKTTDTLSLVNLILSGNTTLGDAQTDTSTINAQLTARQGEFPAAVRAAASDYAAVTFDGATTATRVSAPCQAIGTGDFSMWVRFRVPVAQPSVGGQGVITTSGGSTGAGSRAFGIRLSLSTLNVTLRDAAGATAKNAGLSNFHTNFAGQVVDVVVTRSGSTLKVYINGTDTAYSDTGSGSWSDTVTSTFLNVGVFDAGDLFFGRIYRSVVFNRALSAGDVTELITIGVNPADQWGTQTQIWNTTTLNGGFETAGGGGADVFANWVEFTSGTGVLSRDTVDYSPDLGSTASAKALGTDGTAVWSLYNTPTLVANKRYRISAAHKRSANANVVWKTVTTNLILATFAVTTSWGNYSGEFVMPANEFVKVDGGGNNTTWIDNVILERIGAIVDLDFTVGTGYQATDRSTNNLHGTLFNGVEFTVPRRMAVLYATTTASGNTQMLGTLAIPTNAVIEDVIVNSTGSATVSVGNVSAGTQIVNAASVVSGRQKLTIATPFSTTGNLWVNSSAAVTLQFTIFYTIAA
jgi:hypothetical protein